MEDNVAIMTVDNICNRVYVIRGQQVMLDYDLAEVYGYEVKRLNEQVKRNIARFPEDFMFRLTKNEVTNLKSQFVMSSLECPDNEVVSIEHGGSRHLSFAFTESGTQSGCG